jgi:hypothetical protein
VRLLRIVVVTLMCSPLVACYEEPIREHLHLVFLGGEAVVITALQEVAAPDYAGSNTELATRLDEARADIERGWDRWRRLFDDLHPLAEKYSLEMEDDVARRAIYSAAVDDFAGIERLLGTEGLTAMFAASGPVHELRIYPTGGTRATSSQRDEVGKRIDDWAAVVAGYLDASIELYAHLESSPDRAIPCLSHIFDSNGPESGPLAELEEEMVTRLKDAISEVADALVVVEGTHSLNELSRLAFDPFPARLTVAISGELLSQDGWIEGDGYLERPPVDLWRVLQSFEGRWLAPDLVTAMVAPVPEDLQPEPDPAEFAARPRWFGQSPSPSAVAAALRAELAPLDVHALRWRPIYPDASEIPDAQPRRILSTVEVSLPR